MSFSIRRNGVDYELTPEELEKASSSTEQRKSMK